MYIYERGALQELSICPHLTSGERGGGGGSGKVLGDVLV